MVYGCASSHFTLITIRPIDELFMSIRAMRSGATRSAGRQTKDWGENVWTITNSSRAKSAALLILNKA